MPTLREYRQAMLLREPELGRTLPISSLTAQTIVASRVALGNESGAAQRNVYLLRTDGAAADRDRIQSATTEFAPGSGTFTHDGTAYADTTATSEDVEVWNHNPIIAEEAIQQALKKTQYLDETIIPTHLGTRYWLGALDWIKESGDILKIARRPSRVLTRNRQFAKWNGIDSAGVLVPDDWTLTGSGGVFARSTTVNRATAPFSLSATRVGTTLTITQTPGLAWTGVSADSLRGRPVGAAAWVQSAQTSSVRLRITDGVDTSNGDYHTGGGTFEEITVEHTLNDAATTLAISARVEVDEEAIFDECYGFTENIDDTM